MRVQPKSRALSKELHVMFPVSFYFGHDALEFQIAAQLVPILVSLGPPSLSTTR